MMSLKIQSTWSVKLQTIHSEVIHYAVILINQIAASLAS